MAREWFEDKRSKQRYIHGSTKILIEQCNAIVEQYHAQGYRLSLRQLYYRLVTKNIISNLDNSYKSLSKTLTTGRINGLVDWNAIEDRVRFLQSFGDDVSSEATGSLLGEGYAEDIWADQPYYVEVWPEKDALSNVVHRPCGQWRVPFFACRGYASITEVYNAAKRLERKRDEGKEVVILHVGDHDPSGMDMTRDNEYRLGMFMRDPSFKLTRIALNMDQIKQYDPPPQPTKKGDSREPGYRVDFGSTCWECDALEPNVIEELVTNAIKPLVDQDRFDYAMKCEDIARRELQYVGQNYERALSLLLHADHSAGTLPDDNA